MEGTLIESYCRDIHFWRLNKLALEPESKVLQKIDLMNKMLLSEYLKNSRKLNGNLSREIKNYFTELLMILPNLNIDKKVFRDTLNGLFAKIRTAVVDNYFEAGCFILREMKQNMKYSETVPKIFTSDLILEHKESLFKEKLLKSEEYEPSLITKYILQEFSDFFDVDKKLFKNFVKQTVERYLKSAEDIIKESQTKVCEEVENYLIGLFDRRSVIRLEIQILKIVETDSSENAYWEIVYKGQCLFEDINLMQVLKISEKIALILIKYEKIGKIQMILLENYICRPVKKLTSHNFEQIVPGSKSEALFVYSNSLKRFWKCQLTDYKLIVLEEIGVYERYQQDLISTYFLRHQSRILYVYQSGGVTDFSLKNDACLNYSKVYPQKYLKIKVSDCERFIFLISNSNYCIFNKSMELISMKNQVPLYLLLIDDSLKVLLRNNEEFEYNTFTFRSNHLGETPNSELKIDKIKFFTRMTLDFGKALLKEMIAPNKYENLKTSH